MRVLHLLKVGTGATWALRQVRELVRLGVDIHVALPPNSKRSSDYRNVGAVVHEVPLSLGSGSFSRSVKALRGVVRRIEPAIVHSHFVQTTLLSRAALRNYSDATRVFQVPGPLHMEHAMTRRLELALADKQDVWVASSEYTARLYERAGVPSSRTFLSYYGTDLEDFVPRAPGRLRSELSLDKSTPIVGMIAYVYAPKWYLGQRRGLKGHEDLVEAVALCHASGVDAAAVFVGGPWAGADGYAERIARVARKRLGDRAYFLGTRRDVQDLYADFDLSVTPSLSENGGGAVESLLLGVPTIASDVGGLPEVVLHGKTGWIVPRANPPALARTISSALANRDAGEAMAMEGRRHVASLFDVRKTARDVLEIYEAVACRTRRA